MWFPRKKTEKYVNFSHDVVVSILGNEGDLLIYQVKNESNLKNWAHGTLKLNL